MNRKLAAVFTWASLALLFGCGHEMDGADRADAPLPTGRWLQSGFAEASQDVGSLPVNLLLSPDGKYAITTGAGFREALWSIGTAGGRGVSHLDYKTDTLDRENGLYYGLAFGSNGTLYAAQGAAARVAVLQLGPDGALTQTGTLTYRNFGFYVGGGMKNDKGVVIPENWPSSAGLRPGGHDLGGITDVDFRHFDLEYADSDAPRTYAEKTRDDHFLRSRRTFGKYDAPSRFSEWDREFNEMLKKDPTGSAVPALMTVRFGDDHTVGASAGKPTPRSMVADNDYAVGQLVEAVSRSPIWESTVVFVIEDDAQNGPDHVDAHRSTCYVVSPWVKKGSIDHTFQNTVSVIRTMELLLGLGPMCQYDAASGAILDFDATPANNAPYAATLPEEKIIGETSPGMPRPKPKKVSPEQSGAPGADQRNETAREAKDDGMSELAEESAAMDFTHADRAPADALNRIIWKTVKGMNSEMPPTPHRPAPGAAEEKGRALKDDDD